MKSDPSLVIELIEYNNIGIDLSRFHILSNIVILCLTEFEDEGKKDESIPFENYFIIYNS
jgi:hypothetical protein